MIFAFANVKAAAVQPAASLLLIRNGLSKPSLLLVDIILLCSAPLLLSLLRLLYLHQLAKSISLV